MADEKDYFEEQPENEDVAEAGGIESESEIPAGLNGVHEAAEAAAEPVEASRGSGNSQELVHHPHVFGIREQGAGIAAHARRGLRLRR